MDTPHFHLNTPCTRSAWVGAGLRLGNNIVRFRKGKFKNQDI